MAAGCPVITTDKPVAREILQDGRAGVLVERSVGAFERGILELMGDPELRRRLARNARRAVEQKFELKKILRKWRELYRSLI
jgi:glycosyltransferase involved in cell wall biosynthesis